MTFLEFSSKLKSNLPVVYIEDLINDSSNSLKLLDDLYRIRYEQRMIRSYNSDKEVYRDTIIKLINRRINYDSITSEVMSLFEE